MSLRLDVVMSRLLLDTEKSFPANGNGCQLSRDWQALYHFPAHNFALSFDWSVNYLRMLGYNDKGCSFQLRYINTVRNYFCHIQNYLKIKENLKIIVY